LVLFFCSSRRRHTRFSRDWSSDVCSSDLRWGAKKAHAGVPGGLLNFIEIMIEFIDKTVRDGFHYKSRFVAPLALTIFSWVFLMRSEERRVGKECRSRWRADHEKERQHGRP